MRFAKWIVRQFLQHFELAILVGFFIVLPVLMMIYEPEKTAGVAGSILAFPMLLVLAAIVEGLSRLGKALSRRPAND